MVKLTVTPEEFARMTCLKPTSIINPETGKMWEGVMPMCGKPASHVLTPYGWCEGVFPVKDMTAWCADHVAADPGRLSWQPIASFLGK